MSAGAGLSIAEIRVVFGARGGRATHFDFQIFVRGFRSARDKATDPYPSLQSLDVGMYPKLGVNLSLRQGGR